MTSSKNKRHTARDVVRALRDGASSARAKTSARFFKTGRGEYGENDVFIGVVVPKQRSIARYFIDISLDDVSMLLTSAVHEHRLTALIILVEQYRKGEVMSKKRIVKYYLTHRNRVNNWDLVDSSAPQILGEEFRVRGGEEKLYTLARSRRMWDRRIAIVATHAFIRAGILEHTFAIAKILVHDEHDLMHKAVGWMLREAGKKDTESLRCFLKEHAGTMPRTTLRYSIERFSPQERAQWRAVR